jgi:hypothetical protein
MTMKTYNTLSILLSFALILGRGAWAEHEMTPAETESKAYRDIEAFWKAIDKAQNSKRPSTAQTFLKSARTKLKNIKRKDPAFDVAPLEAAIEAASSEAAPAASPERSR